VNLVASLIVKNELGRYLKPCIEHLEAFCDSIVVVDDFSSDGTFEWLAERKVTVMQVPSNDEFFSGHEGRRRQYLLDYTLGQQPDWVLSIDADEFISDGDLMRSYCEAGRQVGTLSMEEVWKAPADELSIRIDGGWRPHNVPILWSASLSGRRGQQLRIADRALACGREPDQVRRLAPRARPTDASILHFGWAKESGRQDRYERYVTADGGKYHRNAHLESIMFPDIDVLMRERPWPEALLPWKDQIVEAAS
jgi:glycosyltransferase involved in cell wall biosynthesis